MWQHLHLARLAPCSSVDEPARRLLSSVTVTRHFWTIRENQTTSTNAEHKTSITGCQVKAKGFDIGAHVIENVERVI